MARHSSRPEQAAYARANLGVKWSGIDWFQGTAFAAAQERLREAGRYLLPTPSRNIVSAGPSSLTLPVAIHAWRVSLGDFLNLALLGECIVSLAFWFYAGGMVVTLTQQLLARSTVGLGPPRHATRGSSESGTNR
jgi:hypothetical protein